MSSKEKESVICRICHSEHSISESTLCSCGSRIFTTNELKNQSDDLQAKIRALNTAACIIDAELNLRKTRRANSRQSEMIRHKPDFFKNVHGTPAGLKAKVVRQKNEPKVNIDDYN